MDSNTPHLMQEAINQAARHTGELRAICDVVAEDLRGGCLTDALPRLQTLLEGIGCISQALQLTKPLQLSRGIEPALEAMPRALEPLVAALENRDWSLAGEVVLFELQPVLEGWFGDLRRLSTEDLSDADV